VAHELVIRRGAPADAPLLAEFGARTFADTFGAQNRPEDLAMHLAAAFGVPQQTAELTSAAYVTLLGYADGHLAAFAQLRRTAPAAAVTGPSPVELHRFYVDRPWHGRGLAARLMTAAEEAARALGGRTVWLSVWEHTPRARTFYAKCGFADVGTTDFFVGPDRQTDRVLERRLDPPPRP
jgi:GNAT superfamily N-acetyltransferase